MRSLPEQRSSAPPERVVDEATPRGARVLKQAVKVEEHGEALLFRLGDAAHTFVDRNGSRARAGSIERGFVPADDSEFISWLSARNLLEQIRRTSYLPPRYIERHDRTLRYLASFERDSLSAIDMLESLHRSTVLIIGLGGVGSWIAYSLLMSGIGEVIAVDGDDVELTNLNRSAVYAPSHVGLSKVRAAAATFADFFPDQTFTGHRQWIDSADAVAKLATSADFVVSAADTPHRLIRMWIREGARVAGVPVLETMGGAIGPIRGSSAVDYEFGVAIARDGTVQIPTRNLNAIARGPGVPPFHPMTDAAGVCQAIFEDLSGARSSALTRGYVRKGTLVNVGTFHEMEGPNVR